jgi:hypothetical protein
MNWARFCRVLARVAYLGAGYGNGRELLRVIKPDALPVSDRGAS